MIQELIKKAFNQYTPTIEEKENVFVPKIQSTFTPPPADFNEVFEEVHKQLKIKYERRED